MAKNVLFKQIVEEFISPQLKHSGFRKRGEIWNRDVGEIVHVVSAQESRWSAADETAFTVNVGVMVRPVERILWGKEPPTTVSESSCFPRFRVGYLPGVDAGQDLWWKLHSNSEVEHVGSEVARVIEERCLPILNQCRSSVDALALADGSDQWKQPAEKLALGVLMCLGGNNDAGRSLLDDLEADPKLKGWRSRITETRARLREFTADYR